MKLPVIPFWVVKFSVSPRRKPEPMEIVAPAIVAPKSGSLTVAAGSSTTAEPPPVKLTVPAAAMVGASRTAVAPAVVALLVAVSADVSVVLIVKVVVTEEPGATWCAVGVNTRASIALLTAATDPVTENVPAVIVPEPALDNAPFAVLDSVIVTVSVCPVFASVIDTFENGCIGVSSV